MSHFSLAANGTIPRKSRGEHLFRRVALRDACGCESLPSVLRPVSVWEVAFFPRFTLGFPLSSSFRSLPLPSTSIPTTTPVNAHLSLLCFFLLSSCRCLSTTLCGSRRNSGWPWMTASGTARSRTSPTRGRKRGVSSPTCSSTPGERQNPQLSIGNDGNWTKPFICVGLFLMSEPPPQFPRPPLRLQTSSFPPTLFMNLTVYTSVKTLKTITVGTLGRPTSRT